MQSNLNFQKGGASHRHARQNGKRQARCSPPAQPQQLVVRTYLLPPDEPLDEARLGQIEQAMFSAQEMCVEAARDREAGTSEGSAA
ncbi:MAG TPA: hypothetical protein VEX13_01060 [Chloroflexia bacterium]|nr:hypothetical protein [Chloroflexia bacterium]